MSPVSSATGWFKTMFGNKTKDKAKGFEVVRSTPLHLLQERDEEAAVSAEAPYKDDPVEAEIEKENSPTIDDSPVGETSSQPLKNIEALSDVEPVNSLDWGRRPSQDTYVPQSESELLAPMRHASTKDGGPPRLAPIPAAGSIHLPSRSVSQVTTNSQRPPLPTVPRRSSKRNSQGDVIAPKVQELARLASFRGPGNTDPEARVPFTSLNAEVDPKEPSRRTSMASSYYGHSDVEVEESIAPHQEKKSEERARLGTPRGGRIGSFQNEEFVYSHPYDGHFGAQPGPSYAPSPDNNNDRRPMSTGRVVRHYAMEGVYGGELPHGSEAELVEEEVRKNSMKK
jgi:hypothetical protein